MSTSLTTTINLLLLSETKSYLGVTGSTEDARITRLINAVSSKFNLYTGRKLKLASYTTYLDGDGGTDILLDQYPITSNSTDIDIRIDTNRTFGTTSKVDSTSIVIYSEEGRIFLDDKTFQKGRHVVKIGYSAGYTVSSTSGGSTGSMPDDIQYAALETIRLFRAREVSNRVGVRSESVEGMSIQYEGDLPWSVKKVLDLYTKVASQ